MRKRYLLAMGLLAMGLACSGCSKSSGQLDGGIIRIAYNQAPTHPHYQALERAGERFKEATGGDMSFDLSQRGAGGPESHPGADTKRGNPDGHCQ